MARIDAAELEEIAQAAIQRAGAREGMAGAAAAALVEADLQGLPTHGVSRVALYCTLLRSGRVDGAAIPTVRRDEGAMCLIDNRDALPFEACRIATDRAIAKAKSLGIAISVVANSGHTGAHAINLMPVAAAGVIGISGSNAPAAIPPWGGTKPVFGTNPICATFPRAGADPVVIDLSLTTVTRGRIMLAAKAGKPIPDGWALNRQGQPTNDADEALNGGSLFPIGGSKGAMLAMLIEMLCSPLSGSSLGPEADSYFAESGNRPRVGQFFIVIDPSQLAGSDVYG